jgi:hypothetical protein
MAGMEAKELGPESGKPRDATDALACCCGSPSCVVLRHNSTILDSVESDVFEAAKMGKVSGPSDDFFCPARARVARARVVRDDGHRCPQSEAHTVVSSLGCAYMQSVLYVAANLQKPSSLPILQRRSYISVDGSRS